MLRSIRPLIAQLEREPRWSQFRLMQTIQQLWPQIVGEAVAKHTQPVRMSRGTLQVATSTAAWAQNLVFQRQLILAKLNPQIPTPLKEIRFLPAEWHRRSTGEPDPLPSPHSRPPRLSRKSPAPQTPEEALERWIRRVKQAQLTMASCPRCGHPCPPQEVEQGSICCFCRINSP